MKKSNFIALILGTIGVVFFALGMCMAMLPEWGMFNQGIVCGVIGLVVLLITVFIWRKIEGKAPIKFNAKTVGAVVVGVLGGFTTFSSFSSKEEMSRLSSSEAERN